MSFGDSKIGGFSGVSRSDMGVSHLDKMGTSVGSKNSGSSADSFQQALKEEGANNGLSSLLSDRSSAVSKSEDGMSNSSFTSSSADMATDTENSATQSVSKQEGSTGIADSLMSMIAQLVDLMVDGSDKGGEPASSGEAAQSGSEAKGIEGSSATEGAMGADSTGGDEGALNSQDPVELLQMMLELITQLISMLQDKASGTEASEGEGESGEGVGKSDMPSPSTGEKAVGEPSGSASDSGESMGTSGVGETESSEKTVESEGVTDVAGAGAEGEMGTEDTISLLQELLKLLTQMVDMMQGKSADAAPESEEGGSTEGATESAESVSPSGQSEAVNESGAAEEGAGSTESGEGQSIEQLLEPILALLTELVSMMQGKSADGDAGTESGEGAASVGETAAKEGGMGAGEASGVEEVEAADTEEGSTNALASEQSLDDIVKLLTQLIEMLQNKATESASGEEAPATEGVMETSGAGEVTGAGGAESGESETLDKDQVLEKIFTLLTQLLMQMMQQMGGGKD